jgi:hypothetical protein
MPIAHPPFRDVELCDGQKVKVRTWTMAQRAELRPKIAELLDEFAKLQGGNVSSFGALLAPLFINAEEQVTEIVRMSIPESELSAEKWDAMAWEDIPTLAQAIWELHFARTDGGGLLGKLGAGLGQALGGKVAAVGEQPQGPNGSQSPKGTKPETSRPRGSLSSVDAGAATPSN